ncbi:MAG: AAA family ATPase [Bdellovibrionales bacterium]|nr:AAA family ATPase [Bdellovibrionales bacterium]
MSTTSIVITAFRIKNFRSIKEIHFKLSEDNITGLIGQNESGKTSVLEALDCFRNWVELKEDVLRSDESMPEISCWFKTSLLELAEIQGIDSNEVEIALGDTEMCITKSWVSEKEYKFLLYDEFPYFEEEKDTEEEKSKKQEAIKKILDKLTISFFKDNTSILPDRINLEDIENGNTEALGFKAVQNFIKITNLDINKLKESNERLRKAYIDKINRNINFKEFWTQEIGKNKIKIEFNYHSNSENLSGEPFLTF